jgi:hypothetical protein
MSYMGRGITRCAAICLRHLAHEMATCLHSQVCVCACVRACVFRLVRDLHQHNSNVLLCCVPLMTRISYRLSDFNKVCDEVDCCECFQEWPRNWLFAKHATTDTVGESGLHWLFPLWTYRDIEVEYSLVITFVLKLFIREEITSVEETEKS